MELLIELVKLAAAVAKLVLALRRDHSTIEDEDLDKEHEGH